MPSLPTVSLRDIARRIGVSHATVSKALRNDPEISETRRTEVRAVAEALGYRPDPLLQQLAAYRRSRRVSRIESCIGWLNDWTDPDAYHRFPQYSGYWTGARQAAEMLGFRLEEIRLRKNAPTAERLRRMLLARSIRGVLIPPHLESFRHSAMDWSELSVVKIGFSIPELPTHLVASDQYGGGRLAATHLLQAGHRRIGFVSTQSLELNTRGNFSAALLHSRDRSVAKAERIPPLFLDDNGADARLEFEKWLQKYRPTAVVYSPTAVVRWMGGRSSGIVLCSISRLDAPAEFGLNQLPEEVGQAAVEFLVSQLNTHRFGIPAHPRRILIEPSWEGGIPTAPAKPSRH
ncbi:MAG TPA: LacI family DNA-binding transcriptional regulator [Opitutaceae bacterium]|nr:LacI family DNA-binding transcriptional regulator [Opitutaceae bacterium]